MDFTSYGGTDRYCSDVNCKSKLIVQGDDAGCITFQRPLDGIPMAIGGGTIFGKQ